MGTTVTERGTAVTSSSDVRCQCGKLMARWEGNSLVIKCSRCARFVMIHHSAIRGTPPPKLNPGQPR
jgi:phage FluMu protein Com